MAEQISLEALAQRKSMQAAPAAQPGSAAQIETKIEAQIEMLTPEQKKQYNANFEKRLTEKGPHEGKMAPPAEPAE